MAHHLQAGPVQVRYEHGFLRYLRLDGVEVVRMIYFAIRDQYWQTARLAITDELIDQTADSFRISYQWHTDDLGIQMTGQVTITGESDGAITFDFAGKALNSFLKNRVGLCVLHPIDGVTGQPCQTVSPDGQQTEERFPDYISPHQPFFDIQTLRWQPTSGPGLRLDFTGDVFEMEDQRNWTDASFKTYSTPLRLPFPVTMQPQETVQQRVLFSLESAFPANEKVNSSPIAQQPEPPISGIETTQPRIGLSQRADWQLLSDAEAVLLRKLNLSHLRSDVLLTTADWQTGLTNALADAKALGVSLELALFFGNDPVHELTKVSTFIEHSAGMVGSVLLFDASNLTTSDQLLRQVVPVVRTIWPKALLGSGTDGFFADFNRNPFDYNLIDFVTYSVNPQMHAFDDLTLLENIDGQPPTVRTAKYLTGGKPVHISPITLLPRYTTVARSASERLSPPADPRQTTEFGADWTRQSLQALTQAGVTSVTYYETHGPRGLVDGSVVLPVYWAFS
ncbi:hypothetical protein ACFSUS_28245 [Spirosoma soli]|uniref:Uncharacterized protein n=1 Tax=Spirosoma soli TaxID=1770529 RepID=A0ABW5MDD9_9BACT